MQGFSENLPKDRSVEYIVKNEPGSDQKDYDDSAQAFIDSKVDLILAIGFEPVTAAKKVTAVNKIPVILELGVNPATQGIVADFLKPGGNITGISWQVEELTGKRLEFLRLIDPSVKRITIFKRKGSKIMDLPLKYLASLKEEFALTITVREFEELADLQREVLATTATNTDAIYAQIICSGNSPLLIKRAIEQKIPVMFHDDFITKQGATACMGQTFPPRESRGHARQQRFYLTTNYRRTSD